MLKVDVLYVMHLFCVSLNDAPVRCSTRKLLPSAWLSTGSTWSFGHWSALSMQYPRTRGMSGRFTWSHWPLSHTAALQAGYATSSTSCLDPVAATSCRAVAELVKIFMPLRIYYCSSEVIAIKVTVKAA